MKGSCTVLYPINSGETVRSPVIVAELYEGAAASGGRTAVPHDGPVFRQITVLFAAGTATIGILGIAGLVFNVTLLRSIYPGYQTMAFSTAALCILFGTILASHATRPFRGTARLFLQLIIAAIAVTEAVELPLAIQGNHFIPESLMVRIGDAIAGQPTSAISPGTVVLVIVSAIALFLLLGLPGPSEGRQRDHYAASISGLVIVLVSLTYFLSYIYGAPFLYGTPLIPIAAPTALAFTFLGAGLMAAAGPAAVPLRYFVGPTPVARLLRTFLPLTLAIILFESFLDVTLPLFSKTHDALQVSVSLVVFSLITGYAVVRAAQGLGGALETEERKREAAEEALARKNDDLMSVNEELTATGEEIRANLEELARREQELRESEQKYRSLFENMLDGYAYCRMIYDDAGRPVDFIYLEVNRAFDEIIGTKTVTGKRVTEVFPGIRDAFPGLFDIYGRVALNGKPEAFDLDFTPSGKWLHISVYSPARLHFVAVFEDITVRRKAGEALTLYKIFTENAHDIILFIRKRDGRIIEVNRTATVNYGYTREELLGMTIFELRVSEKIETVTRQMDQAAQEGIVFTTLHRKKDGSDIPVEVSSVSMVFENEQVLVSIVRDISERERAADALRQANKKLNLLSSITRHDINNQLFSLKAYLELSKETLGDAAKMSEYIIREERAANAIERQIVFTKEYQDLGVKAPIWQNVEETIQKALAMLPMLDVRVTADVDGLEVYADPLFEKTFYNLIDNSLRYGGPGMSRIRIFPQESGRVLVLTIEDNGVGISAEDKKRLFERGFGHNTGLGLFLSREILAITGISITETGESGKGARFEILVPDGAYRSRERS
jgi:PAS domain S-box-containing protein